MANLIVGWAATDRASLQYGARTWINDNPTGNSGSINLVQIWANNTITGCKVALFDQTTTDTFKCIDVESIGTVPYGSLQTFSGLDLSANAGSYIGIHIDSSGAIDWTSNSDSLWLNNADQCTVGSETGYTKVSGDISLFGRTVAPPAVTTQAVSSILTTSAIGNGTIVDCGGAGSCTRYGIQWDVVSHAGGAYTHDVYTDGGFGPGAFTEALTGLPSVTTIYARAYAVNADGTSYGDEVTFLTKTIFELASLSNSSVSSSLVLTSVKIEELTLLSNATLTSTLITFGGLDLNLTCDPTLSSNLLIGVRQSLNLSIDSILSSNLFLTSGIIKELALTLSPEMQAQLILMEGKIEELTLLIDANLSSQLLSPNVYSLYLDILAEISTELNLTRNIENSGMITRY